MRTKLFVLLLGLCSILFSCTKSDAELNSMIVGTWMPVKVELFEGKTLVDSKAAEEDDYDEGEAWRFTANGHFYMGKDIHLPYSISNGKLTCLAMEANITRLTNTEMVWEIKDPYYIYDGVSEYYGHTIDKYIFYFIRVR